MTVKNTRKDAWNELVRVICEAKKDPQFRKELRQFVKATSR